MPGAGKSTLGRSLSKKLNIDFLDTDAIIENALDISISDYFKLYGEVAFRELESDVLQTVAVSERPCVLATGGGIILRDVNRVVLEQQTTVVYLRCTPDDLFVRLKNDTTRPLLQGPNSLAKLQELFTQRDPLYRAIAAYTLNTARSSVNALVNRIVVQLELKN